jgi:hypothetical protein
MSLPANASAQNGTSTSAPIFRRVCDLEKEEKNSGVGAAGESETAADVECVMKDSTAITIMRERSSDLAICALRIFIVVCQSNNKYSNIH